MSAPRDKRDGMMQNEEYVRAQKAAETRKAGDISAVVILIMAAAAVFIPLGLLIHGLVKRNWARVAIGASLLVIEGVIAFAVFGPKSPAIPQRYDVEDRVWSILADALPSDSLEGWIANGDVRCPNLHYVVGSHLTCQALVDGQAVFPLYVTINEDGSLNVSDGSGGAL